MATRFGRIKKPLLIAGGILVALALLFAGVSFAITSIYDAAGGGESEVPIKQIKVAGQEIDPYLIHEEIPVFDGRITKIRDAYYDGAAATFYQESYTTDGSVQGNIIGNIFLGTHGVYIAKLAVEPTPVKLGALAKAPYEISISGIDLSKDSDAKSECSATLLQKNASGAMEPLQEFDADDLQTGKLSISESGDYLLEISIYGTKYACEFTLEKPDPKLLIGNTTLQQGDIFAMKITDLPETLKPVSKTSLGMANWTKTASDDSVWVCAIPIGNHKTADTYTVLVQTENANGEAQENLIIDETIDITVETYNFDHQNLIIDTSVPSVAEAASAKAGTEYLAKIPPLYTQFDEECYWTKPFIRPVEGGFISTNFGEIRITNGDPSTVRSHYGMDFAVEEGVPVHAGNRGRVVLAEMLLRTGGTVVIEHGGGLKTYYFHMSRIDAKEGAMVEQGELIGAVGSTGYSTGPHLHYEARIGDQAISPSMLFETTAGLYSAK